MNILSTQLLHAYIDNLKSSNIEVLLDKNMQSVSQPIRIYAGFELSGSLHIGHIIPLSILYWFSQFSNCKVYILFSKFHAEANGKVIDYTIYEQIKQIEHFKNCEIILSSSYERSKVHAFDNFMRDPNYLDCIQKYSASIKTKKLIKSTMLNDRDSILDKNISVFLYALYQSADITYLNIDFAIGGTDQRKIHMFHNDEFKTPCSYIHVPLLTDSTGKKISKSLGNHTLHMNDELHTRLDKLIQVCTFNIHNMTSFFKHIW